MMRKPAPVFVGLVEASSAPKVSVAGELRTPRTRHRQGAHVEVTTDEVNVVPHHASMEAVQEGCACITILGDFVVDFN